MNLLQLGLGFTQVSVILTVKRLFRTSLGYTRFINGTVTFIIAFTGISTLVTLFSCHPIKAAWVYIPPGPEKRCLGVSLYFTFMCVHAIMDFITLVLPMPFLLHLKVSISKRIFVISLFGLGLM